MKKFKDWTIPGAEIRTGDANAPHHLPNVRETETQETETLDALCGHLKIFQIKKGHRYSTDDLVLAGFAAMRCGQVTRCLDLGSGLSSIALMLAWRLPHTKWTTIEAQEQSFQCAVKSVAYNGYRGRFDQRHGDFRDESILSESEIFDCITGSPPYFRMGSGLFGDHDQKIQCRFETRGGILDYVKKASKHLAPAGNLFLVFPTEFESQWLPLVKEYGLFQIARQRVYFKESVPPLLSLYQFGRILDFPENFVAAERLDEEPLIIRNSNGEINSRYLLFKLNLGFPPWG